MRRAILTLNAGSSTVKYALFDAETLVEHSRGTIERTGAEAMNEALAVCQRAGLVISAVGHRVVHGGSQFSQPLVVDAASLEALAALNPLAPLHQPHNVAGLRAAMTAFPHVPQVACFDTAFHRGRAFEEEAYALPRALFDDGVRRFGFHGLSYEFIAKQLAEKEPALARGRVVVAHLGSGASLCGLVDGKSAATSMGFSTLDGVPMGTRPGALDAGVVLYLLQAKGRSVADVEKLLYRESGLLGVSGVSNDMRALLASESPYAKQAVDLFVHHVARMVASLATAIGGLDALVFTAGIGERSAVIRERVVAKLAWLGLSLDAAANAQNAWRISSSTSRAVVLVVPTNEERCIAEAVIRSS